MDGRRWAGAVVTGALLGLLSGCGADANHTTSGDDNDAPASDITGAVDDTASTDRGDVGDGPSDAETPAMVTVDGHAYPAYPSESYGGGACRINEDPDRPGRAFVAYFAESGERVELSFLAPLSDMSDASDEDPFVGSLNIGGTLDLSFGASEPWTWTGDGGSTMSGSFTMEDRDGNPAEVTFDITCP